MLFTPEQVSLILEDIDFQGCVLVASILGKEMLTDADKELLKKYKVNLDSLVINFPPAQQAYLFGRLVPILTPNQIGTISYKDFVSYLERNQYRTPTQREIEEYKIVANRSYSYIKGLGTRMKEMTTNFISEAELELATKRREAESLKVIKEELTSAVLERKAVQKITSDIAGRLNDWQRDWGRIVETELQNIYNLGNAQTIEDEHGVDALVYKEVFPGACFPVEDTEFLTKEGFKFLGEITPEDEILTFNLETNTAEYSPLISKIEYFYEGDLHWYKNSKIDLLSTPDHYHLIGKRKKWIKEDIYENNLIQSQDLRNLTRRDIMYLSVDNWNGYKEEFIDICGKKINTEYFSKFMGWWLSEGCVGVRKHRKQGGSNMSQIAISQTKEKNFDEIVNCFKGTFDDRNILRVGGKFICNLDSSYDELVKWFVSLGKQPERFIPDLIKNLDKKYLLLFLDSYLKGDGSIETPYIGKKGIEIGFKKVLYTSSKKMADDLCEVVLKCGYSPSLSIKDERGVVRYKKDGSKVISKHLKYIVYVNKNRYLKNINNYFHIIKNWRGKVGCLEVEKNNTLFIRRKGKMIWSGNCRHCIRLFLTGGIGSRPKVFKLSELRANGTNIGKKVADWKPTESTVHPFCRCEIKFLPQGWVWDEQEGRFRASKVNTDERVHRTSKVRIDVGDRHFEV